MAGKPGANRTAWPPRRYFKIQTGRHPDHADALRLPVAREVVVGADGDPYLLEAAVAVLDIEVLGGGEPV